MTTDFDPGQILLAARSRAGLTQRELGRRAETAQSVIARIERGQASPTFATLARLLDAAGFEARTELVPRPATDSQMLDDVSRILRLTPEERLQEIGNISRFIAAARRA